MYHRDIKIKKQKDQEVRPLKACIKAQGLASRGCKREAIAILNSVIADSPDTVASIRAKELLKKLDT